MTKAMRGRDGRSLVSDRSRLGFAANGADPAAGGSPASAGIMSVRRVSAGRRRPQVLCVMSDAGDCEALTNFSQAAGLVQPRCCRKTHPSQTAREIKVA
jgi:hypothetical protein